VPERPIVDPKHFSDMYLRRGFWLDVVAVRLLPLFSVFITGLESMSSEYVVPILLPPLQVLPLDVIGMLREDQSILVHSDWVYLLRLNRLLRIRRLLEHYYAVSHWLWKRAWDFIRKDMYAQARRYTLRAASGVARAARAAAPMLSALQHRLRRGGAVRGAAMLEAAREPDALPGTASSNWSVATNPDEAADWVEVAPVIKVSNSALGTYDSALNDAAHDQNGSTRHYSSEGVGQSGESAAVHKAGDDKTGSGGEPPVAMSVGMSVTQALLSALPLIVGNIMVFHIASCLWYYVGRVETEHGTCCCVISRCVIRQREIDCICT